MLAKLALTLFIGFNPSVIWYSIGTVYYITKGVFIGVQYLRTDFNKRRSNNRFVSDDAICIKN